MKQFYVHNLCLLMTTPVTTPKGSSRFKKQQIIGLFVYLLIICLHLQSEALLR